MIAAVLSYTRRVANCSEENREIDESDGVRVVWRACTTSKKQAGTTCCAQPGEWLDFHGSLPSSGVTHPQQQHCVWLPSKCAGPAVPCLCVPNAMRPRTTRMSMPIRVNGEDCRLGSAACPIEQPRRSNSLLLKELTDQVACSRGIGGVRILRSFSDSSEPRQFVPRNRRAEN